MGKAFTRRLPREALAACTRPRVLRERPHVLLANIHTRWLVASPVTGTRSHGRLLGGWHHG